MFELAVIEQYIVPGICIIFCIVCLIKFSISANRDIDEPEKRQEE